MQSLLLIGLNKVQEILPALTAAGYVCRVAAPEEALLLSAFETLNPDGHVLELAEDNMLLQHVRRLLREALNCRPIPLLALAQPAHLNPPHLVVAADDFLLPPYSSDELLARMQMLFWRFQRADAQNCIQAGELTLDMARHV